MSEELSKENVEITNENEVEETPTEMSFQPTVTLNPAVVEREGDLGSMKSVLSAALTAVNASYQALTAMQYQARTWVDDTSVGPWLNATNLNDMDGTIEDLTEAVNQLNTNCEALKSDLEDLGESVSKISLVDTSLAQVVHRDSGGYTGFDLIFIGNTTKTMMRVFTGGKIEIYHAGINEAFSTPSGVNN